ncbi:microtubule-associated protein futsch isoform X3 [Ischnura elegans]|uniref:microtubule-associated protein futsch isoform X3 n=1 Tax=Ischnura elegans TaxID=197161 RepID=UPI001ED88EC3|nr:microtubule-associated protein futsch isoform X3 [Ischnura elegans]
MQEQEREEIVREQILQEQISQQQIVQEQTSQEQTVQEVEQEEEQSREPTVSQEILGSPASPPSDLLLDFAEPPSPLGAIDPFCGVAAEFPEDVMTPEDEPSPEEAVVPSGRAPWASAEVEVEDVVAEVVEGVLGGDRRVPFIGPADLSLVDFSTTVTDDSAFEMLTPPTEEKAFGVVNIPEIRVDTPPPSTPEDDTSVAECSQGKDSQEDAVQSPQDVGSPLEEAPPSPLDLGSPQEEVPSSPLEMGSPLEEVAPSPLGVGSPLEEVAPSPLGLGSPLEELAPSPLGLGSPLEEVPTSPLVLGSPMEEMAPSPLGLGRPLEEVPASPLSGDAVSSPDDDGWECVGGVRVEGVPDEDEEASPESTSEGARAMNMFEGTVVEEDDDVEGLVGEQVEFVGEEREPERVVEEEVQEEEVVHPVEVLEVEGCADSAVAGAVGSGMAGGEGSPTEESPPRAAETLTSEQSQSPAPETSTPEPAEEIAMPIGKVVIPSSFTAAEDAADGTIRQRHVDVVSSECGVPASRPSLVDWNAVVKKEEQKVEIESAQDGEAPKKAGTRKVKKDSGDGKKKTKKGKKSDAEKENFSVNSQSNMGSQLGSGFPKGENEAKEMMDEEGLSGISLQELRETYCSQASKPFQVEDKEKDIVAASVPIRDLKKSFGGDELSSECSEEDIELEGGEEDGEGQGGFDEEGGGVFEGGDERRVELGASSANSYEAHGDTDDAGSDAPVENSLADYGSGSTKYYRSFSRLEQRTFGNLAVEKKRAKSLVDLRRQSESFRQDGEGGYFSPSNREPIITGVSVKALRASYCNLVNIEDSRTTMRRINDSDQRSSFNKFDELSKKTVIHVKSVDSSKVQKQFNEAAAASSTVGPSLCRSCCKQVFQMEQIKAERAVWHKNCFRCKECSKQLTVDIYSSHEGQLYCKPHFKELFKPKVVVETENVGPVRPRKPEMIIRENQPVELPPDVVRASDKPDLGLEELSSLNVKSRFRVFEKDPSEDSNASLEKSSSAVNVKRSPSILSKLARFQKKGMDIGVTDDSLNGVPFEQSDSSSEAASSSEEEGDEEGGVVKSSRHKKKERPVSFGKMDDMKTKWESVGANGVRKTREELREERKEEIQRLRSRLFQGKLGKTKEMYEQAVMESEKGTSVTSNGVKRQPSERARSLKERFEKGETGVDLVEDVTEDLKKEREEQVKKAREEELSVFEAGISKKSRTLFLELDKAQKQQPPSMPTPTKSPLPKEEVRKAREVTRQVSDDIVRASDRVEDVQVETADICNKFKFFETYQDAPRKKKPFRITPPREGQVKTGSPEKEIYRDPNVVRCEDHTEDDSEVIVKSHTTTKMLSLFRQMEENATKDEVPEGPKPLKRFTPPPDYTRDSESEEEEEDEEDEDEEEEEEEEEGQQQQEDPNIVRASDKVEDEFLKQALSQNAARAKSLKAKFERWEAEMERKGEGANGVIGDDETPSVDTTRNLRARFESLQSEAKNTATLERQSRPRVNRFVEIQASCAEVCSKCGKRVYPLEKVEANGKVLHKACFRCLQCKCFLRMETYTMNNGNLYCLTHFKQLFISKGNYDDAFGSNQHKRKWSTSLKESKQEEENENVDEKNVKGKGVEQKDNFFDEDSFCAEDLQ